VTAPIVGEGKYGKYELVDLGRAWLNNRPTSRGVYLGRELVIYPKVNGAATRKESKEL